MRQEANEEPKYLPEEVTAGRDILLKLIRDPDEQVKSNTELIKVLDVLDEIYPRSKEQAEMLKRLNMEQAAKKAEFLQNTRRAALGGALIAGAGLGLGAVGFVGKSIFSHLFSAEENAKRDSFKEHQLKEYERTHTLGLEPSAISTNFWRISHPPFDRMVDYRPFIGDGLVVNTIANENIRLIEPAANGTYISVTEYETHDHQKVPLLNVMARTGREEWLLSTDTKDNTIDNRVVKFEQVIKGEVKYLRIRKTQAASSAVEVQLMEPVQKPI